MLPAVMVGDSAGMLMTVWGGNAVSRVLADARLLEAHGRHKRTFRGIVSTEDRQRRIWLSSVILVSRSQSAPIVKHYRMPVGSPWAATRHNLELELEDWKSKRDGQRATNNVDVAMVGDCETESADRHKNPSSRQRSDEAEHESVGERTAQSLGVEARKRCASF